MLILYTGSLILGLWILYDELVKSERDLELVVLLSIFLFMVLLFPWIYPGVRNIFNQNIIIMLSFFSSHIKIVEIILCTVIFLCSAYLINQYYKENGELNKHNKYLELTAIFFALLSRFCDYRKIIIGVLVILSSPIILFLILFPVWIWCCHKILKK